MSSREFQTAPNPKAAIKHLLSLVADVKNNIYA